MDDFVRLTEVESPRELNGQIFRVTSVLNSYKFQIDADTSKSSAYSRGGIFKKIKKKLSMRFEPLDVQLDKPHMIAADLSAAKFYAPYYAHMLVCAYMSIQQHSGTSSTSSVESFLTMVRSIADKFKLDNPSIDFDMAELERLARVFYLTRRARLPALTAFYGGLCAQETLKAITSKFIPFKQWFYLDCSELYEVKELNKIEIESR